MPFVDFTNPSETDVQGVYVQKQFATQKFLPETDPRVIAYRNPPPPPKSNKQKKLDTVLADVTVPASVKALLQELVP